MSEGVYSRYALDPTGENPDNLVIEELHSLSNRPLRFIVPKHSPFFAESVQVFDGVTKRPLNRSVNGSAGDYTIPMISQEATLRFGQDIADSILIINPAVASTAYVTYQVLGGNFQNNIDNIVNIYESFLNDNRMIDWLTGVYGKPSAYPPNLHGHYLSDLFGFETMTFVLEQIKQAILISYSPAWDMLLDALRNQAATRTHVDTGVTNDRFVTLDVLQYAAKRYNFNSISMTPSSASFFEGESKRFFIEASNAPENDRYYWEIEHITTTQDDFAYNNGYVTLMNGEADFLLQTMKRGDNEEKQFKILLMRGGLKRYVLVESQVMTMNVQRFDNSRSLFAAMTKDTSEPSLAISAKCYAVSRSLKNAVRC